MRRSKEPLSFSDIVYVRISSKHLWGAVLESATEIVKDLVGCHHGSRAEIYQSNVETFVDDYVLIFYVPVKDVLRPQIEDSGDELGRDKTSSLMNEDFAFSCLITRSGVNTLLIGCQS